MKHYGDICKLHGSDVPIVDVITGGSPCQDVSLAGRREGLSGSRSNLFFEMVRLIKEMREQDGNTRSSEYVRPRYIVWENVPGVLSSNQGKDFQTVLTEIVKIVKADAPDVPLPKRWDKSGCLMGVGDTGQPFSVAWRVHDAQFWGATQYVNGRMLFRGTPQRRKRIALVADFSGCTAPEILFVRKGMRGNSEAFQGERQTPATGTGECSDLSDGALRRSGGGDGTAISFQERAGKPGGAKAY